MLDMLYEKIVQNNCKLEKKFNNEDDEYKFLNKSFGSNYCVYPTVSEYSDGLILTVDFYAPGVYVRRFNVVDKVEMINDKVNETLHEILLQTFGDNNVEDVADIVIDDVAVDENAEKILEALTNINLSDIKPTPTNNPSLNNNVTNFSETLDGDNSITELQIEYMKKFKKEKCNNDDEILNLYIKTWSAVTLYNVTNKIELNKSGSYVIEEFIKWSKTIPNDILNSTIVNPLEDL